MITTLKQNLLRTLLKLTLGYVVKINRLFNPIKNLAQYRTTPLEQKCLFLLTESNSGSSVIGHFICQSNKIYGLNITYEGWWFMMTVTNELNCISYDTIISIWAMRIAELKAEHQELEYIFDKSPVYASHYQQLLAVIPNMRVVANIRNPYATIASKARRMKLHYFNQKQQQIEYYTLTKSWITHAHLIQKAITEDNIPLVTYEQFCKDPLQIITAFGLDKTEFTTDLKLKVKDYPPQPVTNMNEAQIALLTDWQKDVINEQLSKEIDLLTEFNYQLLK